MNNSNQHFTSLYHVSRLDAYTKNLAKELTLVIKQYFTLRPLLKKENLLSLHSFPYSSTVIFHTPVASTDSLIDLLQKDLSQLVKPNKTSSLMVNQDPGLAFAYSLNSKMIVAKELIARQVDKYKKQSKPIKMITIGRDKMAS